MEQLPSIADEAICPHDNMYVHVMTFSHRKYIAGYTVANVWMHPIRRRATVASALEV